MTPSLPPRANTLHTISKKRYRSLSQRHPPGFILTHLQIQNQGATGSQSHNQLSEEKKTRHPLAAVCVHAFSSPNQPLWKKVSRSSLCERLHSYIKPLSLAKAYCFWCTSYQKPRIRAICNTRTLFGFFLVSARDTNKEREPDHPWNGT